MSKSLFRVEWRPLAGLAPIAPQWRDLASRVLEPNVFYEPAFALAAAPVFGRDAGAGLVWSRATPARLVGLFPAAITRHRYGVQLRLLVGWTHPYGPLGTPLVDAEAGETAIAAWLDYLAIDAKMPKLMLMPSLATKGPFAQALDNVLARRGGRSILFGRHARATRARQRSQPLCRDVRRAQEAQGIAPAAAAARRHGRRKLSHGERTGPARPIPRRFSAPRSLRMERASRHRRRRQSGDTLVYGGAISGLGGEAKARIARLDLDDRAIASLILLQSKDTVWTWKIAYDEEFARASPGLQLMLHATTAMLDDRALARADSCAIANHPMIDHIWRERLPVADRLIHVGPHGSAAFPLAAALEAARRAAIALAKRGLRVFRR
jgi:hypothetical protein